MSIIERLQRLARSEMSALRGDGARRELDNALREAETALADLRQSERTFHADYQDQLDIVQTHEDAAAAAVRAGDDPAARAALYERQKALERADSSRGRLDRVRQQIEETVGLLRGARQQVELETLGAAPAMPAVRPQSPASATAPSSAYVAPTVRAAPAVSPAYSAASVPASPVPVANPYAERPVSAAPVARPQGASSGSAPSSPVPLAPEARTGGVTRFDMLGGAPGAAGVDSLMATTPIDGMLDHFDRVVAKVDIAEADGLLHPADEDRLQTRNLDAEFRKLEVQRLRSTGDADQDSALDRLRQRMGGRPHED